MENIEIVALFDEIMDYQEVGELLHCKKLYNKLSNSQKKEFQEYMDNHNRANMQDDDNPFEKTRYFIKLMNQ
jgi:hypothetical protein